jgi:para-aminobenzoate synthetase component 1
MSTQQIYIDKKLPSLNQIDEDNSVFCLLNSNQYQDDKSKYAFILGVGVADQIEIKEAKNAFKQLANFQQKHVGTFLFAALSYDLKNAVYPKLTSANTPLQAAPLAHVFAAQSVYLSNHTSANSLPVKALEANKIKLAMLQASVSKQAYIDNVNQLKKHLRAGDIYEITYCIAFSLTDITLDPIALYTKLNSLSPMPFSALYKNDSQYVICASPERFLGKRAQQIFSQPIKGTRKRNEDPVLDEQEKLILQNDPKEIAENVMIVDLVRNDLTKSAKLGTIKVSELFGIHTFANLHQMISTVEAELKADCSIFECIQNAFPMGSMTGAPKLRAMEIIEEVENTKRGLYSGSIGYIDTIGDFDFNVIIRSIIYDKNAKTLSFQVGSAITLDADPEKEYDECLLKAESILKALA